MPRAGTYLTAGQIFHVTHRCHNRTFLLRFARDRDLYCRLLREHLGLYEVSMLGYCITSNHVHLLIRAERAALGNFMRDVASEFARAYNRRKSRLNAVWGGPYHATLVEGGEYLFRCLLYIELNMVRAGVVPHPREWKWCSFQEYSGARKRYCLVDQASMISSFYGRITTAAFLDNYLHGICHRTEKENLREPEWTESLAVGSRRFVAQAARTVTNRNDLAFQTLPDNQTCLLKEPQESFAS